MNSLSIDHVIITRFNMPTPGREGFIRAKDGWLIDRVRLFERYCLPAIEAQSIQAFHWLIYFDPDSPQWLVDWIEEKKSKHQFIPIFRTAVSRAELISDLKAVTGAHGNVLLTTNLDNDDGLAVDFVQRLQASVNSSKRSAIYLTQGIILRDECAYLRSDTHNAFCSVSETWDDPVSAWADWHNRLGLIMPVRTISGPPAWLQLVHARNVSNTVHGKLCDPANFAPLFPYALRGMTSPSRTRVLIETLFATPVRYLKGRLRSALRNIVVNVLGKHGFEILKNRMASASNFWGSKFQRTVNLRWSRVSNSRGKDYEVNRNH